MNLKSVFVTLFCATTVSLFAQKTYELQSPNQKLAAEIRVGENVSFSLTSEGTQILAPSEIAMRLQGGEILGGKAKVSKVRESSENERIKSPFYKKDIVENVYNELTLAFSGKYSIVFRLYDDGLAYRFVLNRKGEVVVENETANYVFDKDYTTFSAYVNSTAKTFEKQFSNSFEQTYATEPITKLNAERLKILPLVVNLDNGKKLCITEADLEDYPGMFLNNRSDKPVFEAMFAPYPKEVKQGGHNNLQGLVVSRENYIAKTSANRAFPWRVFVVSNEDKELADCDMVYRLASPSRVDDISWIKPGKVAWEWWNDWNIYGVDFRAGINNDTYKYYIDFASKYGIEYIILDEGWAVNGEADLLKVIPEINLPELVEYGKSKNVGVVLWAGYYAFNRDMENVVKHYSDMGIKGFKIDFMDRDDQEMVNFLYKASEVCAKYHMFVDFHGVFKPTGLQRTFPNVLNYEGVAGLEQLKWAPRDYDMVTYDVTIPFVRMVAGPMDYTQGAMKNVRRSNFHAVNSEPMSQGTRCRQLATYIVFESPFNMLCDAPSNYMKEEECTEFIAQVPTVWDETKMLEGKISEYIATARRSGDTWYIGALTNWDRRKLSLDLSFLEGDYEIEYFKDGVNADRAGIDYKKEIVPLPANKKLEINMAPGGGFAARIYKK